ncbi:hypothetical protein ACFYU8_17790 [Brevibacillus sp. NPDC003359]|uniref:hypothetical protein n=1 Tax=unclassified Brevibacillus TaxID=2684853 RepID=UPI0036AB2D45
MEIVKVLSVTKEDPDYSDHDKNGQFIVELAVRKFFAPIARLEYEIDGVDFRWSPKWRGKFVTYQLEESAYENVKEKIRKFKVENQILAKFPFEDLDYWEWGY